MNAWSASVPSQPAGSNLMNVSGSRICTYHTGFVGAVHGRNCDLFEAAWRTKARCMVDMKGVTHGTHRHAARLA